MDKKDKKTNYDYLKEHWIANMQANIEVIKKRIEKIKDFPIDEYADFIVLDNGNTRELVFSYDPYFGLKGCIDSEMARQLFKSFLNMQFTKPFRPTPAPHLWDEFYICDYSSITGITETDE